MKKLACLIVAALLILAAVTSFADGISVSASYNNGQLTVSTNASAYFTISVDGVGTGKSLTPAVPSFTFAWNLEDGTHTISIDNAVQGGASTTITVGSAPVEPTEPPVEPTEPPVEPTEPPVEPTEPPVEPTEPPVEPTEPPVEPTEPPVEPTEPPVEPTEPPVEPTEPPAEPTELPGEPT